MPRNHRARGWAEWADSPSWYAQPEEIGQGEGYDPEGAEPWSFPPGSPGAEGGPTPDPTFMRWLESHDPRMTVKWNPVAECWVVWLLSESGRWKSVTPCVNVFKFPWADLQPGEPMRMLDRRMQAILLDSDPRNYGGSENMLKFLKGRRLDGLVRIAQRQLDAMKEARADARRRVRVWSGYGTTGGDKVARMYQ